MTMRRRAFVIAALFGLAAPALGCEAPGPRALILADGVGVAKRPELAARLAAFEKAGRSVRVIPGSGPDAVQLAARGDADVAVIEASVPIDEFLSSKHGKEAGVIESDGAPPCRVLEVSAATHPKVDGAGGAALAAALVARVP